MTTINNASKGSYKFFDKEIQNEMKAETDKIDLEIKALKKSLDALKAKKSKVVGEYRELDKATRPASTGQTKKTVKYNQFFEVLIKAGTDKELAERMALSACKVKVSASRRKSA